MKSFKDYWANPNYRIATIIATAMVLWFASGIFANDTPPVKKNSQATNTDSDRAPTKVRAKRIEAQLYPLRVLLKGKTEPNRVVELRAEVGGQVEKLPVEKGRVVERGAVICQLAVEDRQLRVAEAQAVVAQTQIEYDGAQRLKTGGYQSETAIATAKSRLESAKADLVRRQLDLEKTAIRAPFAGVVEERPVEVGELVRVGDSCATILDLDPLLLTAQVSEQEIANISVGATVSAKLITGEKVTGKIRYISRNSDQVTRTFRIEAEVPNPEQSLVAGLTAEMNALSREVFAHLIPASILVLNDDGELGVRVVDENNAVQQHVVQLAADADEGVWVTGLPASTRIITVGQEYVSVGEVVDVTLEGDKPTKPFTSKPDDTAVNLKPPGAQP